MKTSPLLIIATAAILACAAPAASARPAADPMTARPHVERASTAASIAAHHEQMNQQQYMASRGPAEPVSLVDATDADDQFPLVFVLAGLSIPLGVGLALMLAKPLRSYQRRDVRP